MDSVLSLLYVISDILSSGSRASLDVWSLLSAIPDMLYSGEDVLMMLDSQKYCPIAQDRCVLYASCQCFSKYLNRSILSWEGINGVLH